MMRLHCFYWFTLALSLLAPAGAAAQGVQTRERSFLFLWPEQDDVQGRLDRTAPLVTDRPSFTDASSTVGKGITQVELGYTFTRDTTGESSSSSHAYPELSLRQGVLADWLEVRVIQSARTVRLPRDSTTELSDTVVGTKFGLTPQHGYLPELSIIPELRLPSGTGDYGSTHVLPGIRVPYSWNLGKTSWLSGSTVLLRREGADSQSVQTVWAQSALGGTRLSPTLSVWVEWYAFIPTASINEDDTHYLDSGINYLLTSNIQLDARIGTRVAHAYGDEVFTGIGVALRLS